MASDDLLADLTEPQRTAVTHTQGPLLVLAGAGSGKTRVITRRAAYIARTAARPQQVLAITFTNKAAGEMRERISSLGINGRMWICTFHSLCARLLRKYGEVVHVNPAFSIFDQADRRALIREAINNCGLRTDNWQPRSVEEAISRAKNRMQTAEDYAQEAYDFSSKTTARIYAEYQRLLASQNGCDFDDLLLYVAKLLDEHEPVRAELSDRFRYLLIDEYQDTNRAQYLIATRLVEGHDNICATGDPDQSIYAWRGADIHNILDFETDFPEATVIRLEQNFRSTSAILRAASDLIRHNHHRKHKSLWTENDRGPAVCLWTCDDGSQEAARVAADIQAHIRAGGQGGDVAIFYRVNALTRVLEDELRRANIPYQIARGVEFYGRKEIKDVLAYLRVIVNPADETALLRAINTPPRGIGKITLDRLRSYARANGITLDKTLAEVDKNPAIKTARKKVEPFAGLLARLRELPTRPVHDVIDTVLKESGLERSLRGDDEDISEELANVHELVTAARQYDQDHPDGSLDDWLQQISLVSDVDSIELAGGAVTLMTLHTAKGLEFPVVYIVALEDGLLPHARAIRQRRGDREQGPERDIEEERRLFFVGMTRAKDRLILSHAKYRMVRGVTERAVASRFLRELPRDEMEHQTFEAERDRSTSHLGRFAEDLCPFEASAFFPGQRVRHPEYGDGEVLRLERIGRSAYIRVYFDAEGERCFALRHAPLVVLEC